MTMYSINEADMKRILSLMIIELEQMKTLMKEKGVDNLTDNNYKMLQEFTALKDLYLHLKWKSEN